MEKENISISLTVSEWNVVLNSLSNMPFGQVASIISSISNQAQLQMTSKTDNIENTEEN